MVNLNRKYKISDVVGFTLLSLVYEFFLYLIKRMEGMVFQGQVLLKEPYGSVESHQTKKSNTKEKLSGPISTETVVHFVRSLNMRKLKPCVFALAIIFLPVHS